jgi:hypothetical protein
VADVTAVLVQRLASTRRSASARDIAQALYGAATQPMYRVRISRRQRQERRRRDGRGSESIGEHLPPVRAALGDQRRPIAQLLARLQGALPSCHPQDLSMAVYALALIHPDPDPDPDALALIRRDGAQTAEWSSSGTGGLQLPPGFTDAFLVASSPKLRCCSCQALSNIVWGLASILLPGRRHGGDEGGDEEGGSGGGSYPGLSIAIAASIPAPVYWIEEFASSSLSCMGMFSNKELSLMAWALGRLGWHPGKQWMARLEVREADAS